MTAWAHLPNAAHIDKVIASSKATPKQWTQRRWVCASWSVAWDDAWEAAMNAVRSSAWNAARDAAWYFARDAVLALIAYDDCAFMLDSDPGELAILAALGDRRAILLLPACKVFHVPKDPV